MATMRRGMMGVASVLLAVCHPLGATAQAPQTTPAASTTEETRKVALAFLAQMFDAGDMDGAYARYAAPDFVQHNPEMADGVAAHRAYFAHKAVAAGGSIRRVNVTNMLLVDGDLFALHHTLFTGPNEPARFFVDIWRVADGRIIEHWDVIQTRPATSANSNGMGCGTGEDYASALRGAGPIAEPTCGLPSKDAKRADSITTLTSYSTALHSGDVAKAISDWLTADYRQHSPGIADGRAGALAYLQQAYGKGTAAMPHMGPIRTIAEGDFVLQHRLTTYPATGETTANISIFRIRNGQISEHWDLRQTVPAKAENHNGMW